MTNTLRFFYFICLLYCLAFFISWTVQIIRRRRPDHSVPRRSSLLGIVSAFTIGMLPWRKESARLNPTSYIAGILYHIASFTTLVSLAFPVLLLSGSMILVSVVSIGLAGGLFLLLKRVFKKSLRMMSEPGDYVANVLVDLMQLSALLVVVGAAPLVVCYSVAYVVLLYLPFGKLRHCYFFFASRFMLGRKYGRKGVLV